MFHFLFNLSILYCTFQIDNKVHDDILANIYKRNVAAATCSGSNPICNEFDEPERATTTRASLVEDEMPVIEADVNLASAINPITGT
jgi:hypothetical protein